MQRERVLVCRCPQADHHGSGPWIIQSLSLGTMDLVRDGRTKEGLEFSNLNSGGWGMAGSFGYEQGHYEVSQACGERVLFPAVHGSAADDLVVAPGFSSRHQIADFCDHRRPAHR